jgi:hypothetical protein
MSSRKPEAGRTVFEGARMGKSNCAKVDVPESPRIDSANPSLYKGDKDFP